MLSSRNRASHESHCELVSFLCSMWDQLGRRNARAYSGKGCCIIFLTRTLLSSFYLFVFLHVWWLAYFRLIALSKQSLTSMESAKGYSCGMLRPFLPELSDIPQNRECFTFLFKVKLWSTSPFTAQARLLRKFLPESKNVSQAYGILQTEIKLSFYIFLTRVEKSSPGWPVLDLNENTKGSECKMLPDPLLSWSIDLFHFAWRCVCLCPAVPWETAWFQCQAQSSL